ncbi:MAG: alpha-1,2-fucosyltransferase [Muribaculaceae bacterium]|nr:alpha-1,2-fucosyltransferase [Muribaculaceae bacterium]
MYLKKRGYDVKVDYFTRNKLPHENVEWNRIFPDAEFEQASGFDVFRMGGGDGTLSKIRRKFMNWTTSVEEMPRAFSLYEPKSDEEDKYLLGVFQNSMPANEVSETLKKAFRFRDFEDKRNIELQNVLSNENSVAIHVRKGKDYCKIKWYQNTCPIEYYRKAIDYIKMKVNNPKFYVFTDNPDWVKENFGFIDYILVDGNPTVGWGSHFDMQLMSLCKHNIISNSTYSWWSAFLNANPDKIVVIPDIWFNPDSIDTYRSEPLQCEGWIAI